MPTYTIEITEQDDNFIEAGIASGRFNDVNEALRAGLHLLEQEDTDDEAKLQWLRNAAQEGIDAIERGEYTTLHSASEITAFVRSLGSGRRGL